MWQLLTLRASLHLIEEQLNTIVFSPHSLWQVIAIVCALRVFQLTKGFEFYYFFASIIKCEVETCSKWVLKNKPRWCNSPCLGETSLDYTAADERRTKKKTARVENTSATCSFVFRWYIYRWKYFLLTWKNQKKKFFSSKSSRSISTVWGEKTLQVPLLMCTAIWRHV